MLSQDELLKYPNYLLSTYQLEIYKQLSLYMERNNLKQRDVAKKLNFSEAYVSQILNGNFNFTLKKLIELGLAIGKVPYLEFVEANEYWERERNANNNQKRISSNITYSVTVGDTYAQVNPEQFKLINSILNLGLVNNAKENQKAGSNYSRVAALNTPQV